MGKSGNEEKQRIWKGRNAQDDGEHNREVHGINRGHLRRVAMQGRGKEESGRAWAYKNGKSRNPEDAKKTDLGRLEMQRVGKMNTANPWLGGDNYYNDLG